MHAHCLTKSRPESASHNVYPLDALLRKRVGFSPSAPGKSQQPTPMDSRLSRASRARLFPDFMGDRGQSLPPFLTPELRPEKVQQAADELRKEACQQVVAVRP